MQISTKHLELKDELVEEGDEVTELFERSIGHENLDAWMHE